MFQDEARFGRISNPRRCWTPPNYRPHVAKQIVREYTYAYGAVCPWDGIAHFLILPNVLASTMEIFLAEVAKRHSKEFIDMIYDGASCHNQDQDSLKMPKNMSTEKLPPYSPELNPTEPIWEQMREIFFPNLIFESMDEVEEKLIEATLYFENNPKVVRSITGFKWIVEAKLNK